MFRSLLSLAALTLLAVAPMSLTAQYTAQRVEASQVPSVVTTAQASAYPGQNVRRWEKRTTNKLEQYTAVFTNSNARTVRVRYSREGTRILTAEFFGAKAVPANIASAAQAKIPGTTVTGAKLVNKAGGKSYYAVQLRKPGVVSRVYVSPEGAVVPDAEVPSDVQDEGAAPNE